MENLEGLLSVGSAYFQFCFQGQTFVYRDGKRWFFTHDVPKVPASCVENILCCSLPGDTIMEVL